MTIAPAIGLPRLDRASPARWGFPGAVAWWLGITVAACAATPPADSGAEAGSLWLPAIFADRMVLQREMPVPVWGRCEPGAEVSVAVVGGDGQSVAHGRAVAEQTGRWRVNLPALAAGGPWSLVVTAQGPGEATHRKTFADVLIGEVWIACGQSNMGFQVGTSAERAAFEAVAGRAKLTRYGMDCYAYALLAAGQVDLVIEAGLNAYDIQAPIAVIQAAGGIVTDWNGGPAHDGGRTLAAANPDLHAAALAILRTYI